MGSRADGLQTLELVFTAQRRCGVAGALGTHAFDILQWFGGSVHALERFRVATAIPRRPLADGSGRGKAGWMRRDTALPLQAPGPLAACSSSARPPALARHRGKGEIGVPAVGHTGQCDRAAHASLHLPPKRSPFCLGLSAQARAMPVGAATRWLRVASQRGGPSSMLGSAQPVIGISWSTGFKSLCGQ